MMVGPGGVLTAATLLPDLAWPGSLLTGVEYVEMNWPPEIATWLPR
jgi:hypothetical protein